MPRKLLSDGQRGWYGWEGHFNSVLRMSVAAMWATNVKNERERFLHRRTMAQIKDDRRESLQGMEREARKIRQELTDMSAHRVVYRQNSFVNWEKRKKDQSSTSSNAPRTQTTESNNSLRLPALTHDPETSTAQQKSPVGTIAETVLLWHRLYSPMTRTDTGSSSRLAVVEKDGGVEGHKTLPAPESGIKLHYVDVESNDEDDENEGQRSGGTGNNRRTVNARKPKLRGRERVRVSTVLPEGCKGVFFVRRFIDKETERFMAEMAPANIRRKCADRRLRNVRAPTFIDARRSTSAIMREFSVYRSQSDLRQRRATQAASREDS